MLEDMSSSETIAVSSLLKEAAAAKEAGQSPASCMQRVWRILNNAHVGGRLSDPKRLYDIIDTALNTEGMSYHLSKSSKPLQMGIENGTLNPSMRRGYRLELDIGL